MHLFDLREYNFKYTKLSSHVQWFALCAPGIVLNEDGSFMATIRYNGLDQESATSEELMALIARVNNYLKVFGEGWCFYIEARRVKANVYKDRTFPDKACQMMDYERQNFFNHDQYFIGEYYFTLQFLPKSTRKAKIAKLFYRNELENDTDMRKVFYDNLESFQTSINKFFDGFSSVVYSCHLLDDEEMLTYLHSCVSLRKQKVKRPLEPVCLGDMLCDMPFFGGSYPILGDDFENEHITPVCIRSFPPESFPCMLDELNRLNMEYRWVTRFICRDKVDSQGDVETLKREWKANDKNILTMLREFFYKEESVMVDSTSLQRFADADDVLVELGNNFISIGDFTSNIIISDSSMDILKNKVRAISRIYSNKGFTVAPETMNAASAWLGSLPGNAYADPRRKAISSLNLCHILPLSSVWSGDEYCKHLSECSGKPVPAIAQVETEGSTPFFLNIHVGDVGHSIVVGPTGSGKSVLLNFLASQFRSVPKARIYVFDKGASSRVFAAAVKGNFYDLGNDDSANNLAFQPLRYIDDENEKVWASEWLQELFVQEGVEMNPEKRKAIWDALTSVAATPPDERTLTAIKVYVQNMELRDALEPFVVETKGIADTAGAYGKLFDSDTDSLKLGSYQSFEMGELMSKKNAVMPTLLYLFHVIEKNCDGSPTFIILDECWTFLDNPIFAEKIREWLKTMRKNNVSIIFATQNLEDIKKCSISSAIIESCMTRFFLPNAQALNQGNEEVYGFFNLNYRERQIIADSRPKHDYYIVSAEGKRRFDLALSPYALSILAASSKDDQAECERIKKSYPDDDFMVHWLEYKGLRDAKEAYMAL